MTLPAEDSVLGIDVGYSARRPTTGFCCLWWDTERVNWRCAKAGNEEGNRRVAVRQVMGGGGCHTVLGVAIDGPLRPDLQWDGSRYRAAEAILSGKTFQKRGKPGQTHAGSGPRLHEEATKFAEFTLACCGPADSCLPFAIRGKAIFEAFPNMFFGVLCDEAEYPARPAKKRKWTDTLYPQVRGKLCDIVATFLPGREIAGDFQLTDHEHIAGFACALTALSCAAGRCVAVGSHDDGFIILPSLEYWGAGSERPWAERDLRSSIAKVRGEKGRFPNACVYRDRDRWL